MSERNFLIPQLIGNLKEGSVEAESVLYHEHSVQTVKTPEGEKAIWAIVSDFNTMETMRMLSVVCDAFRKLGRRNLANGLWNLARCEDFGINKIQYPEGEHERSDTPTKP